MKGAGKVAPAQKPGRSKQDYQTPKEFLTAIKVGLLQINEFAWDLAANAENTVAKPDDGSKRFYDEADDSLKDSCKWVFPDPKWAWLNPPFGHLVPWVHKAYIQSIAFGAHVCMLVPASVGSNWWADCVHDKALVYFVRPRLTFVGESNTYPKDLAILLYTPHTARTGGYETLGWR